MASKVYTTSEVAKLLGVHINTVRTMVQDGRLKAFKTKGTSGHLRFNKEVIDAFKESNDLSRLSPSLIPEHFLYASRPENVERLMERMEVEQEQMYLKHILTYFDPLHVFGMYLKLAPKEEYSEALKNKAHKWIAGGFASLPIESSKDRLLSGTLVKNISIGYGSVDLGEISKPVTHTLILHTKEGDLVLDGTLQQYFPSLEKGIIIMDREIAESFYIRFQSVSFMDYIKELESQDSEIHDRVYKEVLDSEFPDED